MVRIDRVQGRSLRPSGGRSEGRRGTFLEISCDWNGAGGLIPRHKRRDYDGVYNGMDDESQPWDWVTVW